MEQDVKLHRHQELELYGYRPGSIKNSVLESRLEELERRKKLTLEKIKKNKEAGHE
jgi:hypothetical protein